MQIHLLGHQFVVQNSGDKVIVVLNGQDKIVCPWAEITTCRGIFQEELPQDMVWIVNDGSVKTLISYHRQVLKGWMISRKVSAVPKPSDQPFQLTPVRRGGVSTPRRKCIHEGRDGRHFSYQPQLSRLKAMQSKHPKGIDGGRT